ncbi:MAG: hypothetical protein K6T78_05940 [Alicyclobacillus sp.]|nr:hypothetical protein [Alicyclobacillus sp.]
MKRSFWRSAGILLLGAVLGTIAGQLLAPRLPVLTKTVHVSWHPQVDVGVVSLSIALVLRVNWLTLVGAVAGWLAARKRKP